MSSVILVIHLFLALAIIGLVLLQRSEGGGLGIGGGGGLGGLSSAKGTANALSRATGICAAAFFCTSLILGILAGHGSGQRAGLLENVSSTPAAQEAVVDGEAVAVPDAPVAAGDNSMANDDDNQTDEAPAAPVAE